MQSPAPPNDLFATLRLLLHNTPPSQNFFRDLLALLGNHSPPPHIRDYLSAHLATWDPTIPRRLEGIWLQDSLGPHALPPLPIFNAVVLSSKEPVDNLMLCGSPHLHTLQHVHVSSPPRATRRWIEDVATSFPNPPPITHLTLQNLQTKGAFILREHLHAFPALTSLNLRGNTFKYDSFERLFTHSSLPPLTHLTLSQCRLGPKRTQTLLHRAPLQTLESLNLSSNQLDIDTLYSALSSTTCPNLNTLTWNFNSFHSPPFQPPRTINPNLHTLDLSHNPIQRRVMLSLCKHGVFQNIHTLSFSSSNINDATLYPLTQSPYISQLRALYIHSNIITDDGTRTLAQSPHLTQLNTLDISYNPFQSTGFQHIGHPQNLPNLHTLRIGYRHLDAPSTRNLLTKPNLHTLHLHGAFHIAPTKPPTPPQASSLHTLRANLVRMNDGHAKTLFNNLDAPTLHTLDLKGNLIGPSGLKHILHAINTHTLRTLNLANNQLRPSCLDLLHKKPELLQNLHTLDLRDNDLPLDLHTTLPTKPPWTHIPNLQLDHPTPHTHNTPSNPTTP